MADSREAAGTQLDLFYRGDDTSLLESQSYQISLIFMSPRNSSPCLVFKCSSVGGPPYETAVTSNRQRRDIQLNIQILSRADTIRRQAVAHRKIMSHLEDEGA